MSQETALSLVKGQKVDLTKTHPGLKKVNAGLGWDVNSGSGDAFDLDAFALALVGGKLTSSANVIYFNNKAGAGITHSGDNLTGAGDGDDETIFIDLTQIPSEVDEVLLCVNIYEASSRRQNFGQVKNSFVRLYDAETQKDLVRYDLNEDYSAFSGIVMGKLYRKDGEWKFQAVGEGRNGDINTFASSFR